MRVLKEVETVENDLSRDTIVVLVVLAVLISVIGTWTVITQVNNVNVGINKNSIDTAKVKLDIQQPTHETTLATGKIILDIKKGGE